MQLLGLDALRDVENVPAGHAEHELEVLLPPTVEYVPALHGRQVLEEVDLFTLDQVPTLQLTQIDCCE